MGEMLLFVFSSSKALGRSLAQTAREVFHVSYAVNLSIVPQTGILGQTAAAHRRFILES
ncbi:hypothetical protein [Adlercreutzia sp. ZJ305]|uniref:hypothetical protein n=1 Tax=Adlercreutzia sp. ZJ305 TaxID=2709408 RepID=UPI0013EBBC74|nr:hypothetical protein [Adlercreutzia sp. ZJ305]